MVEEHTGIDEVADIIEDITSCVPTTVGDDDGRLPSRPVVVQQVRSRTTVQHRSSVPSVAVEAAS